MAQLAVGKALDKMGTDGASSPWIQDTIRPLIGFLSTSMKSKTRLVGLGAGYCLGTFKGIDIIDKKMRPGNPHQCMDLPISDTHEWSVFSVTLPAAIIAPLVCPAALGPRNMELCVAYTACGENGMPSIAVHINEPLVTCMIGNHALTLASSGFNNIIASATKLGLHHINTGLSSPALLPKMPPFGMERKKLA